MVPLQLRVELPCDPVRLQPGVTQENESVCPQKTCHESSPSTALFAPTPATWQLSSCSTDGQIVKCVLSTQRGAACQFSADAGYAMTGTLVSSKRVH